MCWRLFKTYDAGQMQSVQSYDETDKPQESHRPQKPTVWQQHILEHLEKTASSGSVETALPRLVNAKDYQEVGQRMGWQFVGRVGKNNLVVPEAIPFTAWQTSAVYSNKPCGDLVV